MVCPKEANVPIHERCGQADVSSAYNVAEVGNDAHGNPAKIFVRKTSWDHAVQMVRGEDGVTRAVIDWGWFKGYRDVLLARVAAGKKVFFINIAV